MILLYRFASFFFVFGMAVKCRYFLVCDGCGAAVPVDVQEASFEKHPIAFMDRFGVVILLAVLIAVLGVAIVMAAREH